MSRDKFYLANQRALFQRIVSSYSIVNLLLHDPVFRSNSPQPKRSKHNIRRSKFKLNFKIKGSFIIGSNSV